MPNESYYISANKGMTSEVNAQNSVPGTYSFALNAILTGKDGEVGMQNEMSTHRAVDFPPGYQVVGTLEVPEQHRTIYALVNPSTGNSQIGEVIDCTFVDSTDLIAKSSCEGCPEYLGTENVPLEKQKEKAYCQYRMLTASACLGFDKNFPVQMAYKITSCTFNLYFTDFLNERSYMYFDYSVEGDHESPLVLQDNFKVTTYNPDGRCACEPGYTYDIDTNKCIGILKTPLIPSGDLRVACKANGDSYTNFGVAIYDTFNIDGTGASHIYHLSDTYWSNPLANTTDGILNRVAIWPCGADKNPQTLDGSGNLEPINEYVGFVFPVDLTATKTYYVGVAGDNLVRIRLDCTTIVEMNPYNMGAQYHVGTPSAFKYWHVYPLTIPAGHHVIELTGYNYDKIAGFGAEIYDNTKEQIIDSADGGGLNIVFSTKNMVGKPLQISNSFAGTCDEGCVDIDSNGNLFCSSKTIKDPVCDPCDVITVEDQLDCDKIKFHPTYERPCINFEGFVNGGNLKEGVYQILLAYSDSYGRVRSSYFPGTSTMPLFEGGIQFETNNVTNKALSFTIDNLESGNKFEYYNIVVASTINQFTEFTLIGTFPTSQRSYTYTGFENVLRKLSPTEVFFTKPYYPFAEGITTSGDYLFFSDVKEYPILNLQPVANSINLHWETIAIKERAYSDPRNTFYFHTYQRDEVYPFGIVFEFDNGRDTAAFHIPGRAATSFDLEVIDNNDVITNVGCNETIRNRRWQVYNTGRVIGGDHIYTDKCDITNCWEYGSFSYWESTELYPKDKEIWGELCGTPIRHHKFPDSCVTHIHDGSVDSKPYEADNHIFPIGVQVDHESVLNALAAAVVSGLITQEQRDSIKSYRIVRGNRVGHKSIDAKGLLFNMFKYNKFGRDYYYPNYSYNDIRPDSFLDGTTLIDRRYTFHSPDVHFTNSALGDILKIETEELGKTDSFFTKSECQARQKFLSGFIRGVAFGMAIAAALSASGEKHCEVITYTSPAITQHYDVDSNGKAPYGNVQAAPTPSGSSLIHTSEAHGTWNGTSKIPDVTTNFNNVNYPVMDDKSGARQSLDVDKKSSRQITSCSGLPFQLFNNPGKIGGAAGEILSKVNAAIQSGYLGILEMGKIVETLETLIPWFNYSVQYDSVGKYNNYTCVEEGRKVRSIDKSSYLNPIIQEVDEPSDSGDGSRSIVRINNWNRESSVYLKTNTTLQNPKCVDDSKVAIRDAGLGSFKDVLDKHFTRNICSYYASVKRYVPDQYGQICNIEYISTNPCSFYLDKVYSICDSKVFGGDTFINRFALKRKMPFFTHTMCGMPDGSDVLYSELANAGTPKYFFNTSQTIGERLQNVANLAAIPAITSVLTGDNADVYDVQSFGLIHKSGYIHLFNYGIPNFFVESDVNVDFRYGENNTSKDFYPHNTDLKEWLEEANVPQKTDNFYRYNNTYSKQNKESIIVTSCIRDKAELTCQIGNFNRLIYSESSTSENREDNWLVFKANSYYDFPLTLGKLISADGIENDKVLARLEKGTQIFAAYNTLEATEENIQVGTGGMFKSNPKDIATTTLGYAGSQHRSMLHTEFGHIWSNAAQGQIFMLGTGASSIDEISKYGREDWFRENLPFFIHKDFRNITLRNRDNNFDGVGLHFCFDKRYSRIILTKLDYKLIDKKVQYNADNNTFYLPNENGNILIDLKDPKYFCNKSWTISFACKDKEWGSFHTYTPNFYIQHSDHFESSYSKKGNQMLYGHNLSNKSYQVFYGKLQPFIVEVPTKAMPTNTIINSIEYNLDVIRNHNEFDRFYNNTVTFNKALIYNNRQTTGWLNLKVNDPDNLSISTQFPALSADGIDVLVTNSEDMWRFNDFYDISINQRNNVPLFSYDCANVNKVLNSKAINYSKIDTEKQPMRQHVAKIRFVNDLESNYNFVFNFGQVNSNTSNR